MSEADLPEAVAPTKATAGPQGPSRREKRHANLVTRGTEHFVQLAEQVVRRAVGHVHASERSRAKGLSVTGKWISLPWRVRPESI